MQELLGRGAGGEEASEERLDAARRAWAALCLRTGSAAAQLCETLRLVLSPTQASRLRGDYKTGKRINMRRVIQFIASH